MKDLHMKATGTAVNLTRETVNAMQALLSDLWMSGELSLADYLSRTEPLDYWLADHE